MIAKLLGDDDKMVIEVYSHLIEEKALKTTNSRDFKALKV